MTFNATARANKHQTTRRLGGMGVRTYLLIHIKVDLVLDSSCPEIPFPLQPISIDNTFVLLHSNYTRSKELTH